MESMPNYKSNERRRLMNIPDSRIDGKKTTVFFDKTGSDIHSETLPANIFVIVSTSVLAYTVCLPLVLKNSLLAIPTAWIVCLLCALTVLMTARKLSVIAIVFILGFFPISYTGQPIVTAVFFGAIICLGNGSAAICTSRGFKSILFFLLPLLSYTLSYVIILDPVYSLASLIPYLPVFAMGLSCRFGAEKKTSIIVAATFIVATIIGLVAVYIQNVYGTISKEAITAACSEISRSYINMTEKALIAAGGEVDPSFHMQLQAMTDLLINSAFGLTVSICLVAVYLAFGIQYRIIEICGICRSMTANMTELSASVTAALIFIISHILTYTTNNSGEISIAAVVGMNLCYILMPLLALKGCEALKLLVKKYLLLGLIAAVAIVIAILAFSTLASSAALVLVALVGALYIIIAAVDKWAKEHFEKAE